MKVSVITITYNNEKSIDIFLKSVFVNLQSTSELIIVDNKSSDETVKKILAFKEKNPGIKLKLIESVSNLGFAVGCNLGAKAANNDFLFFLNPDTKLFDSSFYKLAYFLEENPRVGLVAPQLINKDGKIQSSVRNCPTLKRAFEEYILGKKK